ncbi:MAG: M48 family metallopeptidase [Candidatus Cyclobacteriaceae bacterium M3_2C_046]
MMQPETILLIILIIITFDFLLEQVLDFLNLKNQKPELPSELKDIYNEEKYKQSVAYHKTQTRFSFLTATFSFLLAFALLSSGFFGWLDEWLRLSLNQPVYLALAFFGLLFIASDIINTPFQVYSTFVIEEKFGFNKTTPKTFVLDKLKGYLLTAIVGGVILGALLYLIIYIGQDFWIYFWIVISLFILFINMFYTSLIVPLFNKLTPLEDGELKQAIEDYSRKVNFPLDNIFVIDGSKRSSKANAFFSGIGKKKKIVLYDTLINNHTTSELVAVLAHEVGHFKKKHIVSGFVLSIIQTGVMLFIMSLMIFSPALSQALGADQIGLHLNLLAFGILYAPISKITGILLNVISRKNEYEADAFATLSFDGSALQLALKKLSVNNLSNLLPHPWYVFFHYSHPPLLKRLKAIDKNRV